MFSNFDLSDLTCGERNLGNSTCFGVVAIVTWILRMTTYLCDVNRPRGRYVVLEELSGVVIREQNVSAVESTLRLKTKAASVVANIEYEFALPDRKGKVGMCHLAEMRIRSPSVANAVNPSPSFNVVSTASRHGNLVVLVILVLFILFLKKWQYVWVGPPSRPARDVSMVPPFALNTPFGKAKIAFVAMVNHPHS